ncbi:MAG: 4Fe-4S binding protein, partial [Phycisphaerae bacterium]|nr:4Fe-4S binding protein [Phycisphaerae bacterium]
MNEQPEQVTRRGFLTETLWGTCLAGLGGLAGLAVARSRGRGTVWQIDPAKCIGCGRCATHCVLQESAVKCVHTYS